MSDPSPSKGFTYEVSDEQIATYRSLSLEARLRWLEETRRFAYAAATDEVRERWRRLRRGESIVESPAER